MPHCDDEMAIELASGRTAAAERCLHTAAELLFTLGAPRAEELEHRARELKVVP